MVRKFLLVSILSLCLGRSAEATPTLYVGCTGPSVGGSYYGLSYVETITPNGAPGIFASNLTFAGGIAFDSYGNLDVTEQVNMANTAGVVRIAPNGTSTPVTNVNVGGIAFCETADQNGNIYIGTSTINGGITKVTPAGVSSTFSFATLPGSTGSHNVRGMTFNTDGNMYATSGGYILQIQPNGTASVFATGNLQPTGGNDFVGVVANSSGDLFAADFSRGQVDEITPNGQMSTFASGLNEPTGIAIDSVGDLFVADIGDGTIDEISPTGTVSQYASGLADPEYIAIAPVPEPASAAFFGAAIVFLSSGRKMRKRARAAHATPPQPSVWCLSDN